MFNDGIGTIIPRITMQSISPGIEIDSQIIDALATVLNEQERMKLKKEKRRYYLPVGVTVSIFKIMIKNSNHMRYHL